MIHLLDTGPLVSALARTEPRFGSWAKNVLRHLSHPLFTCEAVLTEATHFLGKVLVSQGGGAHARWRRDGRALYYIARRVAEDGGGIDRWRSRPHIATDGCLPSTLHCSRSNQPFVLEVLDGNRGFVFFFDTPSGKPQPTGHHRGDELDSGVKTISIEAFNASLV